jgi:uncharacterized protein YdeI (YjbR/CyaY-like superfamily)
VAKSLTPETEPVYFETPEEFRAWLDANHETAGEFWIGYYKKGTGKPSITWPQAVAEALCFGWIDGVAKSIDAERYIQRFTPRRPRSIWSAVNIKLAGELIEQGRMRPAGLKAFEERTEARSGIYSHEQEGPIELGEEFEARFRDNERAWRFFQSQAPSYQRATIWWVISAKQEKTRQKRLATLIADSEAGRSVPQFSRRSRSA